MNMTQMKDEPWGLVNIDAEVGQSCGYKLINGATNRNAYQIRISESHNALFGLYFYSGYWDSIVDHKIFTIDQCKDIRYCMIDDRGRMVLTLYEASFATLNVIPD